MCASRSPGGSGGGVGGGGVGGVGGGGGVGGATGVGGGVGGVGGAGVGAPQPPAPGVWGLHEPLEWGLPPVQSHDPQQSVVCSHWCHAFTHAVGGAGDGGVGGTGAGGGVGAGAGVGAPQLPAPGELGLHEPPVQSHAPQHSDVELHGFHAFLQSALAVWTDASATIAGRMMRMVFKNGL
jgi:hypothetical protein